MNGATFPFSTRAHVSLAARLHAAVTRLCERIALADAVANERRMLAGLDQRMLRDLGIDPATADAEARRGYWDLPATRCR